MSATRVNLHYFSDSPPQNLLRSTVRTIRETEWGRDSAASGELDYQTFASDDDVPWDGEQTGDIDSIVESVRSAGRGRISVPVFEPYRLDLYVRLDDRDEHPRQPLWISGPPVRSVNTDEVPQTTVDSRTEALGSLFVALAERFDPWYAAAAVYDERPESVFPVDSPPNSGIERLPWLSVFGPEWIDSFGGVDRMREAPASHVEELATGGFFFRERERPWPLTAADDSTPAVSTYEYLFERRSLESLWDERRRKQHTIVDPFRTLDPGDRGSDLVMCAGHAPLDAATVDYRTVTDAVGWSDTCFVFFVYRDEQDRLREVRTDMFVRRLVDEDGQPIGRLPAAVSPEDEWISLSVGTDLEPRPAQMFTMNDTSRPSVMAKFFGLAIPSSEADVWQDNGVCRSTDSDAA